ncbi:hypothetical protein [Methylopila turkensis]|uniref:Ribbon-helix-helix protein CopG domain-containing protein n=1 Tax=Methylopila turkensis TaxID=1437816 RepID=A0A9W6JPV7_9HYPH|nr:hypothetical protein [Methylopila turkensis]GLK80099.1 hypothetical protein GCM10008174_18400 [Methylopila turkensis]
MADAHAEKMALRTVYLPLELDQRLRSIAFTQKKSKGELIRDLIVDGLKKLDENGVRTLAERMDARAAQPDVAPVAAEPKPVVAELKRRVRRRYAETVGEALLDPWPASKLEPALSPGEKFVPGRIPKAKPFRPSAEMTIKDASGKIIEERPLAVAAPKLTVGKHYKGRPKSAGAIPRKRKNDVA